MCVRDANLNAITYLYRFRADPNVMSETGFTSLILAAAGGHLEVVKTLVEKVRLSLHVPGIRLSYKLICAGQCYLRGCLPGEAIFFSLVRLPFST